MNIFNIDLPIAGIEFNALLLILIGFCVGVLGGFFGVGGGWIVTPALNIFGFHMAYAIGTDLANIFGQSIGATKKHHKMGNVDWKLGGISILASIVGLELGSQLIIKLEKIGDVGSVVRWCYLFLMFSLSTLMFIDYFKTKGKRKLNANSGGRPYQEKSKLALHLHKINLPPIISLPVSGIERVSLWAVLLVFASTGFLSGFLGVGGGFIRMPALVYLIGVPTAIAVGTDLMSVLASGAYGCFTYAMKGRVEIFAAVLMLLGSSVGAQIGATAVKYVKGYGIRLLFAIMIAFAGFSIALEQVYKMTGISAYQKAAGILLMGTAASLTVIVVVKLFIEYKKEKKKGI
ncbi:MAG: sulfite exporter TauE/SafE family protein [Candidatus Kryptoniota bacterium]